MTDTVKAVGDALLVLIVEDSPSDAALMVRLLTEAGFAVQFEIVDDVATLRAALASRAFDVVLADFSLPGFDAEDALAIVRASGQDLPFIVVSGVIGDERAIRLMRHGAQDYVLKQNLVRLAAAVRREVDDARERASQRLLGDALRHSEQQRELLVAALDSASAAVAVCSASGVIEWVNPAFTASFGYQPEQALGEDISALLVAGEDQPQRRAARRAQLLDGHCWSGEVVNRRQDGRESRDLISLTPVRNAQGEVSHVVAILHDVSQQRQQEQRQRLAQRMEAIGQLTGGIAHDFNNLLVVILGNAELLGERLAADPQLGPMADMIVSAAERGADLIRALLAFARRQNLAPQAVDANALLRDLLRLLQRSLGQHISIELALQAELPMIQIDRAELESALLNLCLNARDAMPQGGTLRLATALGQRAHDGDDDAVQGEACEAVYIEISDTGCGIPADTLERIFEPFFTTKEHGRGTGLGLARVHGFVTQSGGRIEVESRPGHGTRFRLCLPRVDRGAGATPASALGVARDVGGSETILLVEDEPMVRDFAQARLRELGYRVLVAGDAAAALLLLDQHPDIDLLFTDIVLPGGVNGHQLAERARHAHPGLRVLASSGFSDPRENESYDQSAVGTILRKPYRRADLARAVRAALDAAAG